MDEQKKKTNETAENDIQAKNTEEAANATVETPTDAAEDKTSETSSENAAGEKATEEKPAEDTLAEEKPAEEESPAEPAAPDWKGMYARMTADFDNFRKRTAREREDLFKSAAGDVIKDLLPTVDNLSLALDKAENKEDPFVAGVKLVYDGLIKMLADHGATPVDSLGEPLNTDFHEAIATLPSPDVPEGHVMNEVKRGWLLNGKLLRAAQVVVSAGKGE